MISFAEDKEVKGDTLYVKTHLSDLLKDGINVYPFLHKIEKRFLFSSAEKEVNINWVIQKLNKKSTSEDTAKKYLVFLDADENGNPLLVLKGFSDIDERLFKKLGFEEKKRTLVGNVFKAKNLRLRSDSIVEIVDGKLSKDNSFETICNGIRALANLYGLRATPKTFIVEALENNTPLGHEYLLKYREEMPDGKILYPMIEQAI